MRKILLNIKWRKFCYFHNDINPEGEDFTPSELSLEVDCFFVTSLPQETGKLVTGVKPV